MADNVTDWPSVAPAPQMHDMDSGWGVPKIDADEPGSGDMRVDAPLLRYGVMRHH
ncbi:hypothetical protein GCM10009611_11790 [Arthrobacter roseus]